jgi:cobalt-zinc-cadmium efflux system membrane fusion protein
LNSLLLALCTVLHVAHVFSPVAGRVTKVLVHPGERVKKGQPLARIASPDISAAVTDLQKAQASSIAAEHDFERQKQLYQLCHSRADYEAAQGNYLQAKAELERARESARLLPGDPDAISDEYTLTAPIRGLVLARIARPGDEVQGMYTGGAPPVELFTIGEIDDSSTTIDGGLALLFLVAAIAACRRLDAANVSPMGEFAQ